MFLLDYNKNYYSQSGEDGVLAKIFEVLGIEKGICMEFGANDGLSGSNTHYFIKEKGWHAILLEPVESLFNRMLHNFDGIGQNVLFLNESISFDGENSFDPMISRLQQTVGFPSHLDLLSIDIDGNDYHIFDSIKVHLPKVVVIEYNMTIPNHLEFVQARDMNVSQGSSILSLVKLANSKQYQLVSCVGANLIFVRDEYFPLFGISDNSPDALNRETQYYTYCYQLYDGTIKMAGFNRLLWHNIPINEEQIQMLPKHLRKNPLHYQ